MNENLITLKIKYLCMSDEDSLVIQNHINNYNNVLRFTYNRKVDNPSITDVELNVLQKSMNNVFLGCWFLSSARIEAKEMLKAIDELNKINDDEHQVDKKCIIFGSKKLFTDRCKGLISREDFNIKRYHALYSVGEYNQKGNRYFRIISDKEVVFKPNNKTHIKLSIDNLSKKYKSYINKLVELQNNNLIPITYKLDTKYIYITFDLNYVKEYREYTSIKNRVFAIDMNPNYIGYSVVDWKDETTYTVVNSGVFSLKPLNDKRNSLHSSSEDDKNKYFTNKRKYEVIDIAHQLVKLCKHFKCELFSIEKLSIKSSDKERGKRYNKLVNNQWCRKVFVRQIEKMTSSMHIHLIKVKPEYSSFTGNILYRKENLPDPVLSSIEIGRRAYEFNLQYCINSKSHKKNIIFPEFDLNKTSIQESLEELEYCGQIKSWLDLYSEMKKSKFKYRLLLEDLSPSRVSRINYNKRRMILYNFI